MNISIIAKIGDYTEQVIKKTLPLNKLFLFIFEFILMKYLIKFLQGSGDDLLFVGK